MFLIDTYLKYPKTNFILEAFIANPKIIIVFLGHCQILLSFLPCNTVYLTWKIISTSLNFLILMTPVIAFSNNTLHLHINDDTVNRVQQVQTMQILNDQDTLVIPAQEQGIYILLRTETSVRAKFQLITLTKFST